MNLAIPLLLLTQLAEAGPTSLPPGGTLEVPIGAVAAGEAYRVQVSLAGPIRDADRVRITLETPGGWRSSKTLHAGDPDFYLPFRPLEAGNARLIAASEAGPGPTSVRASWSRLELSADDAPAIEVEPNDSWRQANRLVLGRAVHGSADDVDYLDNLEEGKAGLDWFRFEVPGTAPSLVYFHLELLDRDVSANLRVHRRDPSSGEVVPEESGKDPMEMVHDRERERYSTHLSRTLAPGAYFLEVNANHPDYILRTRNDPVPPQRDPAAAVEAGLDYLLEAGDAWFAQIPREGNAFVRSANLHDTATRCTACHASSYPTEASLIGLANGYPIRAKASMLYLMDRLANSPTPLYGTDGLFWQRFIAVPLQAQGKQGGILLDYEDRVLGRRTPESGRFGPFLRAAWRGRRSLPADEVNGVVPLDSKFGLAWRDWRVLTEMTRRTGRVDDAQAADAIADLLDDPATDRQVETLQDRIHRLHAWGLVDRAHFAPRIQAEAEAILALQNPDGGWHELDRRPGPSAVYTTGQLTWTLLRLGFRRDDPRIARALAYLLAQQQPFGGWFQATTHENFRTPMRETRYAVEALAEAFPREGGPRQGWGNRGGGPPRFPRSGPLVALLDDLDDLWDVPEPDRPAFARAVAGFLDHPEPLVRARAAACLGRLGDPSAVEALAGRLGDHSKVAWRAAAWALRRLGNEGHGMEAIRAALRSPDPATRRGAARIFAYQFSGMDGRVDLADALIERAGDPDLWTRLQALRSLRQWFYRTNDPALRRRIVDAYLARMAEPDAPVVRKALAEGMYVLLDENLGGGVSLQKNLAALPEKFRRNALEGRKLVEREVLLGPILAALESGNARQREALVRSFDGSFFRGRSYARQPSGMLDVGNDREFGFLVEPAPDVLDRAFAALLAADSGPEFRRRSIQLAAFFRVPARTTDASIQSALLRGLSDPDPSVRDAAGRAVGDDLDLAGSERDPARLALIRAALSGPSDGRKAVVRAIARSRALLALPEVAAKLRSMAQTDDPGVLLPVLASTAFSDEEALAIIERGWVRVDPEGADDRVGLVDALVSRPALLASGEPAAAGRLLRLAIADRSERVRARALAAVDRLEGGKLADRLLLTSLADDSPAIRRRAVEVASARDGFWARPETLERLLALLADPDPGVRQRALASVERLGLAKGNPAVARRVRGLAGDPALGARAEACLIGQGFDPGSVAADAPPGRPGLLSLSRFRDEVNPLFYQAGDDGQSCFRCHAGQGVFRVGEPGGGDSLASNYNAALKVINRGDPESSLLLRKPRSPLGRGAPDPASPTGLTHVGGPRWEGPESTAYRAILGWIRAGSAGGPAGVNPVASADGHAPGFEPSLAADGDPATCWRTEFLGANPGYPHELTLDLGSSRRVDGLLYVPRQDASAGRVKEYEVRLSDDGLAWSPPVARGAWPDDPAYRHVPLPGRAARFVQLRGLSEVNGLTSMSVGEAVVDARDADPQPVPGGR